MPKKKSRRGGLSTAETGGVRIHYGENNVNVGPLKEIPEVCVDHFYGVDLKSQAFFLTHAHTDHMVGLEGPAFLQRLEDPGVVLYMSMATPMLLAAFPNYLGGRENLEQLMSRYKIVELKVNVTYPITIRRRKGGDLLVHVTPLSAGHCPGSVMFLFETDSLRILHTGDFRKTIEELKEIDHLHLPPSTSSANQKVVKSFDHLYIDTTFCSMAYTTSFPCRKEVLMKVFSHIQGWISKSPSNWISIQMSAKFAHEYVLTALHKQFGQKVHVAKYRYDIYKDIDGLRVATSDNSNTQIHCCENGECMSEGSRLELRLTTQWYTNRSKWVLSPPRKSGRGSRNTKTRLRDDDDGVVVRTNKLLKACYAMHPTVRETVDAVDYLKPKVVTPLVKPYKATLTDVKEALQENCTHSFHYNDYRTPPEYISSSRDDPKRVVQFVRNLPSALTHAAAHIRKRGSGSISTVPPPSTVTTNFAVAQTKDSQLRALSSPVPFQGYLRPEPFFDSPPPFSPESIGSRMSQSQHSDTDFGDRCESSPSPSPVKHKKKSVLRNRGGGENSPMSSARRSLFNTDGDGTPMRFRNMLWKKNEVHLEATTTATSDGSEVAEESAEAEAITIDDGGSESASTTDFEEVASNASNSQSLLGTTSQQHDF